MSDSEARKLCAKNSGILAPITNKEDAEAIYKTIKMGQHEGCPFYQGVNKYSIGLKVTACGKGKQKRVFSNGVVWNETLNASLCSDRTSLVFTRNSIATMTSLKTSLL